MIFGKSVLTGGKAFNRGLGAWISVWRLFKECRADVRCGLTWGAFVPFKFHSKGRHHIPRQRHRVTNWRDYDAALRNRRSGSAKRRWRVGRRNLGRRLAASVIIQTSPLKLP
jgi:hypothetical protein